MCTHIVKGKTKNSKISIGNFTKLAKIYAIPENAIYITDDNLASIYKDFLRDKNVIVVKTGEINKNLSTMDMIYDRLIEMGADRKSFIIGFGGGVVTDIAGFAASTFMRGIDFGFIPTSLLAMVDASIGGKNGVNHRMYKNMIGNFNQPEFVLIDSEFLSTLPGEEYINGMAEAIKHLLIADKHGFDYYSGNVESFLNKNENMISSFLCSQTKIKVDIVNRDERESGERKKLNFGHTFGHAIEKLSGIKHGFAVSIGMVIAAKISHKLGFLSLKDVEIIERILEKTGLLVSCDLPADEIMETIFKDKKKHGDNIDFIVLEEIGKAKIFSMKIEELEELFRIF
jgi:3-dehydroquinate synthase